MHEPNYEGFNLIAHNWLQVLAYLAVPVLLVSLGVIWPIMHPPAQGSASPIDPVTRQALLGQWNETYGVQPPVQRPLFASRTPSPTAIVVASH